MIQYLLLSSDHIPFSWFTSWMCFVFQLTQVLCLLDCGLYTVLLYKTWPPCMYRVLSSLWNDGAAETVCLLHYLRLLLYMDIFINIKHFSEFCFPVKQTKKTLFWYKAPLAISLLYFLAKLFKKLYMYICCQQVIFPHDLSHWVIRILLRVKENIIKN